MKKLLKSIHLLAIPVIFNSCATKPEAVPPSYVSHVTYLNFSCEQLAQEQARLVAALSTASDAQRSARTSDTVGVIFLGLPVSSLSGSNQASNIGRLKGELEAVQKAMIAKGCESELVSVDQVVSKGSGGNVYRKNDETPKPSYRQPPAIPKDKPRLKNQNLSDQQKKEARSRLVRLYATGEITREEYDQMMKEIR